MSLTKKHWNLVFFLEPEEVNFVQDGTRNEDIRAERKKYSEMLKAWFDKNEVCYYCISGDYLARFDQAKILIERELHISTRF